MHKWNDEKLEKKFNKEKEMILSNPIYNFTDEEVSKTYLDSSVFKTKSARIWRMITLAFSLGKLSGIKSVDEGKTPISLDPLEQKENRYEVQILYANSFENGDYYGDIYTDIHECIKEHPNEELMIGFGVLDNLTGFLADETSDWYYTYEEAVEVKDQLIRQLS